MLVEPDDFNFLHVQKFSYTVQCTIYYHCRENIKAYIIQNNIQNNIII